MKRISDIMRTGNVVMRGSDNLKSLCILTEVTEKTVRWVSFSHDGSSGTSESYDHERDGVCGCYGGPNDPFGNHNPIEDCPDCNGSGYVKYIEPGFIHNKVLASNCKDYILRRLLKKFDF
jgi:hypothetical protein